jgi:hypothetical protein
MVIFNGVESKIEEQRCSRGWYTFAGPNLKGKGMNFYFFPAVMSVEVRIHNLGRRLKASVS